MIDQILYVNLDRRSDRNEWFLNEIKKTKVPMDIVERVPAKDWQDYPDNVSLLKAMQADGYALNIPDEAATMGRRGFYAWQWTQCACLRRVVRENRTTLLMQDDAVLNMEWSELQAHLAVLPENNNFLKIWAIQLYWYEPPYHRPNVNIPYEGGDRNGWLWNYGIRGVGNKAIIWTPPGANRILAMMQGGFEQLYETEGSIYENLNCYKTFHPKRWEGIIKLMSSGTSDIQPDKNPKMIDGKD